MNAGLLQALPGGIAVNILATPGASADKVRGIHGNALKVAVRAPPERGKANAAIAELLAEYFGLPESSVTLESGETSRNKRFLLRGLTLEQAMAALRFDKI